MVSGRGPVAYREGQTDLSAEIRFAEKSVHGSGAGRNAENRRSEKKSTPAWAKTQKMPAISSTPKSLATWTTKLNPMTMLRGFAGRENFSRPIVQTELSLDRVKVVHNDLTDADVEIIPMKSRPAREL